MKKIAVLMYGHLRTYEKTFKSLIDNIVKANDCVDVDIFISTWDDKNVNSDKLLDKDIENVISRYKPKMIDIVSKDSDKYTKHLLSSIEGNSIMAINTSFSIINCHNMMFDYEVEKDFRYDYIILTRPDIFFNQKLDLCDLIDCKVRGNVISKFNNSLFVPYILSDYYGQIMDSRSYICGIDLFCIYSRDAADSISSWEISDANYKGMLPEFALTKIFNENETFIHYLGYEKDRAYHIQREGYPLFYSKFFSPFRIISNIIFFTMFPFFLLSGKFRQKIFFNIHLLSLSKIKRLWNFLK